MRAAIFIPDTKAERHDRIAQNNGLNRSEFYVKAGDMLAEKLSGDNDLTRIMNEAIDLYGDPSDDTVALRSVMNSTMFDNQEW